MKQTALIILTFLLLSSNLFGQYSEIVFRSSNKTEKSLKEVWEYKSDEEDSSLTAKEYYSDGMLQLRQSFWNDTLRKETTYKYDENKQPILISETYKDINKNDTSKSISVYLYDQYKNLYLERHLDSLSDSNFAFHLRYQQFTSYIYQDSLIIYSNLINDLGDGFQTLYKRFEYDAKRHLKKIFCRNMWDTTGSYNLAYELFYDQFGNHVKTIQYCEDYITDREGNKIKQPCENNLILNTYNSKQQLIEEFHHYHYVLPFTNVNFQKDIIKYYYDENGRLVSVFHTMEQDRKFITNRYYKY